MNAAQVLANLSAADRAALLEILNTRTTQEVEQNDFPAVADQVYSRRVQRNRQTGDWYATDGKMIANNPKQFPGYQHAPFPRMMYRLSEREFETVLIDPKTGDQKPTRRRAKSKVAAEELRKAGWKPVLEAITVPDETERAKREKAGWIESPASLKSDEDEDEPLIALR